VVAAAELIQPRVVQWLRPHHPGEVAVEEGVPLQFGGHKEDEVAFLVQPGAVDLGGDFESSETQEEGEGDHPPIHQTRDDSLEQKGAAPAMMTVLVGAAVAGGAVGGQVEGGPLGVVQPEGAVVVEVAVE
jgi:hypothetical protein